MILKHIRSIKAFGIFSDYTHSAKLPSFERYNLIYGWNGSGKTTLARLMRCFETGKIYEDEGFVTGTFIIDCNGSPAEISDKNLTTISGRVKVFNKDFIEENLDFDVKKDGKAKPITHIGKANIEKSQKLKELKEAIWNAEKDRDKIYDQVKGRKSDLAKQASVIAREIKGITQTARQDQYQNYDKSLVEKQYRKSGFTAEILTSEEQESLKAAINAENKVVIDFISPTLPALKELDAEIETILRTQILATETIEHLKENLIIEDWVRQGIKLHTHTKGTQCNFCGNALTQQRLDELQKHFSGEREIFLKALDVKISVLEEQKKNLSLIKMPHVTELFTEFQEEYKGISPTLNKVVDNVMVWLDKIIVALTEKKKNPYGSMCMSEVEWVGVDGLEVEFFQKRSDIQKLIAKHNKKTANFDSSIKEEKEKLEYNILAIHKPEYEIVEKEIEELTQKCDEAVKNCQVLECQKHDIEKEIQATRIACETINSNLKDYLGHEEIKFEDFEDSYLIKRNGKLAKNLSEGEKSAIAFVYFIATLKDNFDPASSVVIIDDPISSLDANNMHHAFYFMVAHTKEAGQLFILTHNFSFLRKVKQWFKAAAKYEGIESEHYQVLCSLGANRKRAAHLTKLDPLLKNYDSEYHYLFKLLIDCDNERAANDNVPYEDLYPLVNAGRKVLETFLDFKYPSNLNKYSQLTNAKVQVTEERFDETKAQLLYGLLNDGSHAGFDTGGFDTFRNSPEIIKRTIEALLDFIREIDPVITRISANVRA